MKWGPMPNPLYLYVRSTELEGTFPEDAGTRQLPVGMCYGQRNRWIREMDREPQIQDPLDCESTGPS